MANAIGSYQISRRTSLAVEVAWGLPIPGLVLKILDQFHVDVELDHCVPQWVRCLLLRPILVASEVRISVRRFWMHMRDWTYDELARAVNSTLHLSNSQRAAYLVDFEGVFLVWRW